MCKYVLGGLRWRGVAFEDRPAGLCVCWSGLSSVEADWQGGVVILCFTAGYFVCFTCNYFPIHCKKQQLSVPSQLTLNISQSLDEWLKFQTGKATCNTVRGCGGVQFQSLGAGFPSFLWPRAPQMLPLSMLIFKMAGLASGRAAVLCSSHTLMD